MNLGITVIGAVMVAVCATPIVYFVASDKNQKKQLLQSLKTFAAQHNHSIHQFEICTHLIIGLDNKSNTLYMMKMHENKMQQHFLNLQDVAAAILETQHGKNTTLKVVERLGIKFLPKKGHVSDLYWEFYNSDDTFQLNGELQLAQSWVERINKGL